MKLNFLKEHLAWILPLQSWSELLVPLVNTIKKGCENKSALFIDHLIFQ